MSYSIHQIYDIAKSVREEVIAAGIQATDVDMVSAVVSAWRLCSQQPDIKLPTTSDGFELPLTFVEWAADYDIKSHSDQFLAAAVYLYTVERQSSLDTDDVIALYTKARWDRPKNPADVIGKAANKGYFTEESGENVEDSKKRWRLTQTGLNAFRKLKRGDDNE